MNPSNDVAEIVIRKYPRKIIAMKLPDEGAYLPTNSNQYLKSFDNTKYCIVSLSSNEHLKESIDIFGE